MEYVNLGAQGVCPDGDHALSSHLVVCGGTRILIDMGNGSVCRLRRECALTDVDVIILSHLHFDHIADAFVYDYAAAKTGKRIKTYIPSSPADIAALFDKTSALDIVRYDESTVIRAGKAEIGFTRMTHPVETYAVTVKYDGKKLFYTGDTNYNERIAAAAEGSDLMIADAALLESSDTVKRLHLTAREAARIAADAGVKKLVLAHRLAGISDEEYLDEAGGVFAETYAAEENAKIIL